MKKSLCFMVVFASCLVALTCTPCVAQTFYCSPGGTGDACSAASPCGLGEALDQAQGNRQDDTVYLLRGVYQAPGVPFSYQDPTGHENSSISLQAAPGLTNEDVVLDGGNSTCVLAIEDYWHGNSHVDVRIRGITFRNGRGGRSQGGGLLVSVGGDVAVTDSRFVHNVSQHGGGAMLVSTYHKIVVSKCLFVENNATLGEGGGLMASAIGENATLMVLETRFVGNRAYGNGGGASLSAQGRLVVGENLFKGNASTANGGGGVLASPQAGCSEFLFYANIITGNRSRNHGGGAYIMENNLEGCEIAVVDNLVAQNGPVGGASLAGGGLYHLATQPRASYIANNTICDNNGTWGPQAYLTVINPSGSITLVNNIIWDHAHPYYYAVWIWTPTGDQGKAGKVAAFHNDYTHIIRQKGPDQYVIDEDALDASADNMNVLPGFAELEGPHAYELGGASSCLDAGTVAADMVPPWLLPPWDLKGNARVWECAIDMGAIEYGSSSSCMGDLDHDLDVDGLDIYRFMASGYGPLLATHNAFRDLGEGHCHGCTP